jgi:hypothetical protein
MITKRDGNNIPKTYAADDTVLLRAIFRRSATNVKQRLFVRQSFRKRNNAEERQTAHNAGGIFSPALHICSKFQWLTRQKAQGSHIGEWEKCTFPLHEGSRSLTFDSRYF